MFANTSINRLYIHSGLLAFSENVGGVFIYVYLLASGLSAPAVFCAIAAVTLTRYLVRPVVVPLGMRFGTRRILMLGATVEAFGYLTLVGVHGLGAWLVLYIALGALGSTLYWTCYHAYFAATGDEARRGRQTSTKEAINALIGSLAPAIGGLLLGTGGSIFAFGVAALAQILAAGSLIGADEIVTPTDARIDRQTRRFAMRVLFSDSFHGACANFVWQIALFIALGEHFGTYGATMAFAALCGAGASYASGRLIDWGHGREVLKLAFGLASLVLIVKAAGYGSPGRAVVANALGASLGPLYVPTLMTPIYNLAKHSACPLRFHAITEGAWDLGCAAACLATAGGLSVGVGFRYLILLGLGGALAAYLMLKPQYQTHDALGSRSRRASRTQTRRP